MWNRIPQHHLPCSSLPLLAAALLAAPSLLLAQAETPNVETAGTIVPSAPAAERSPEVQALHAARAAGDVETVRRLGARRAARTLTPGSEANGPLTLPVTTTVGGVGLPPGLATGAGSDHRATAGAEFGADVRVRSAAYATGESDQCLAAASDGHLFMAYLSDYGATDFVQVYHSIDGGANWAAFGYVLNASAHLTDPSIAIGEGVTGNTVLLAYVTTDATGLRVPEVATADISGGLFTTHSVPIWNWWEGYAKPVIATDSVDWSSWYAYLTCEGVFDSSVGNINGCSWRCTDGGTTWTDAFVPFGDTDTLEWIDPDVTYGTLGDDAFLSCYNASDYSVYATKSVDYGMTWAVPSLVATLPLLPTNAVDPEIAAAVNNDNVMICFTGSGGVTSGGMNIYYSYSTDAGTTWGPRYILPAWVAEDEYAVSLTANEGGGSWHLAYTSGQDHSVRYAFRPQDLSGLWSGEAMIIDDLGMASTWSVYAKKGIASHWASDEAFIIWSDARDSTPGDTDTYVDRMGHAGVMIDQRLLSAVDAQDVEFTLNAGAANAGRTYFLVCTMSGYDPGMPLPGGGAWLPINPDSITLYPLLMGPPLFTNFIGPLDGAGQATATLNIPANSGLVPSTTLHFAYALWKPWNFASNPVALHVAF